MVAMFHVLVVVAKPWHIWVFSVRDEPVDMKQCTIVMWIGVQTEDSEGQSMNI